MFDLNTVNPSGETRVYISAPGVYKCRINSVVAGVKKVGRKDNYIAISLEVIESNNPAAHAVGSHVNEFYNLDNILSGMSEPIGKQNAAAFFMAAADCPVADLTDDFMEAVVGEEQALAGKEVIIEAVTKTKKKPDAAGVLGTYLARSYKPAK